MRVLLISLPVLSIVILVVNAIARSSLKSQCTASTEGKLVNVDYNVEGSGGSLGRAVYNAIYYPVYEYVVEGMAYWAQLDRYSRNPGAFEKTVNVSYNPVRPELCYIDGFEGKNISTYNKDEYDKNSGGKNLTSDYKWRP